MANDRSRWVKLVAAMMTHPKVEKLCEEAGPVGLCYYVGSLAYSGSNGTEGRIYPRAVDSLPLPFDLSVKDRRVLAKLLVKLSLWEEDEEDGYVIHNWSKWQDGYKGPAQAIETYERPSWVEKLSPSQWITSDRVSGSEVSGERLNNSLSLSLSPNATEDARGTITGASARQRDARTRGSERVCTDCGMPHGLHVEGCSLSTGPVGLGTFASGASPIREEGGALGGPSRRCPSCGVGWGIGHAEGCDYETRPRHLTSANGGAIVPPRMSNADQARAMRQSLRDGKSDER